MSLLDDAKQIAEIENLDDQGYCMYCPTTAHRELHVPDCPWLAMPKIVAALEAADRLIDRGGDEDRAEWIALAEALDFPMQGEKVTT